jgi:hypothetical protein
MDGVAYSAEQIENIAQGITLIRNNRYLDFRIGYKTQIRLLDSVLRANGVSSSESIEYFTTISDNWLYANRTGRSTGSVWTHFATLGGRFGRSINDREEWLLSSPEYRFTKDRSIVPSLSIHTSYAYSYQHSLEVQTSYGFTVTTGADYIINDRENGYSTTPLSSGDLNSEYRESVQWVSRLRANYQYLYQPNTRNLFTVNVRPSVGFTKTLPEYLTPSVPGLQDFLISPNIQATVNYYHWFSPHLNITASGLVNANGNYSEDQSNLSFRRQQFTFLTYDFRVGVNYQLF